MMLARNQVRKSAPERKASFTMTRTPSCEKVKEGRQKLEGSFPGRRANEDQHCRRKEGSRAKGREKKNSNRETDQIPARKNYFGPAPERKRKLCNDHYLCLKGQWVDVGKSGDPEKKSHVNLKGGTTEKSQKVGENRKKIPCWSMDWLKKQKLDSPETYRRVGGRQSVELYRLTK